MRSVLLLLVLLVPLLLVVVDFLDRDATVDLLAEVADSLLAEEGAVASLLALLAVALDAAAAPAAAALLADRAAANLLFSLSSAAVRSVVKSRATPFTWWRT